MLLRTLADDRERQAMLERLSRFRPEARRRWGSMSAGGAVCHLAGCFEMAVGTKAVVPKAGFLERTVLKFGALRIPLQWPHGVDTLPELVEGADGIRPGDFDADRARLMAAFGRFVVAESLPRAHPNFGPMSRWDWMRWGYLHTDHHLRQFGL